MINLFSITLLFCLAATQYKLILQGPNSKKMDCKNLDKDDNGFIGSQYFYEKLSNYGQNTNLDKITFRLWYMVYQKMRFPGKQILFAFLDGYDTAIGYIIDFDKLFILIFINYLRIYTKVQDKTNEQINSNCIVQLKIVYVIQQIKNTDSFINLMVYFNYESSKYTLYVLNEKMNPSLMSILIDQPNEFFIGYWNYLLISIDQSSGDAFLNLKLFSTYNYQLQQIQDALPSQKLNFRFSVHSRITNEQLYQKIDDYKACVYVANFDYINGWITMDREIYFQEQIDLKYSLKPYQNEGLIVDSQFINIKLREQKNFEYSGNIGLNIYKDTRIVYDFQEKMDSFTIIFWMKPQQIVSNSFKLISLTDVYLKLISLGFGVNQDYNFLVYQNNNEIYTGSLSPNQWKHITIGVLELSRNQYFKATNSVKMLKIYIDNTMVYLQSIYNFKQYKRLLIGPLLLESKGKEVIDIQDLKIFNGYGIFESQGDCRLFAGLYCAFCKSSTHYCKEQDPLDDNNIYQCPAGYKLENSYCKPNTIAFCLRQIGGNCIECQKNTILSLGVCQQQTQLNRVSIYPCSGTNVSLCQITNIIKNSEITIVQQARLCTSNLYNLKYECIGIIDQNYKYKKSLKKWFNHANNLNIQDYVLSVRTHSTQQNQRFAFQHVLKTQKTDFLIQINVLKIVLISIYLVILVHQMEEKNRILHVLQLLIVQQMKQILDILVYLVVKRKLVNLQVADQYQPLNIVQINHQYVILHANIVLEHLIDNVQVVMKGSILLHTLQCAYKIVRMKEKIYLNTIILIFGNVNQNVHQIYQHKETCVYNLVWMDTVGYNFQYEFIFNIYFKIIIKFQLYQPFDGICRSISTVSEYFLSSEIVQIEGIDQTIYQWKYCPQLCKTCQNSSLCNSCVNKYPFENDKCKISCFPRFSLKTNSFSTCKDQCDPDELTFWNDNLYGYQIAECFQKKCGEIVADQPYQSYLHQTDNKRCVYPCDDGYYGNSQSFLCKPCLVSCATCIDQSYICTSCNAMLFLKGSTCLTSCGQSFKNYMNWQCEEECSSGYTIKDSNNNLYACVEECGQLYATYLYVWRGHCYENIPDISVFCINYQCDDCHSSCQQCQGPNNNDCLVCYSNSYLLNNECVQDCGILKHDQINWKCAQDCPLESLESSGVSLILNKYIIICGITCQFQTFQFRNECYTQQPIETFCLQRPDYLFCELCSSLCTICSSYSSSDCQECISTAFQYGTSCFMECPDQAPLKDTVNKQCVASCSSGFSEDGYCVEICQPISFIYLIKNACYTVGCPIGTFNDVGSKICQECYTGCATCFGSNQNECLSCIAGYFIDQETLCSDSCLIEPNIIEDQINRRCVQFCPIDSFLQKLINGRYGCKETCPEYYYSNICVSYCPSQTYQDGLACISCASPCSVCFGKDVTQCTQCDIGYFLYQSTCQLVCPDENPYGNIQDQTCVTTCPHFLYLPKMICFDSCPTLLYRYEIGNQKQCVDNCLSKSYLLQCSYTRFSIKGKMKSFIQSITFILQKVLYHQYKLIKQL